MKYARALPLALLGAAASPAFAVGVDLTALTDAVTTGVSTVGPAIMTVAGVFIVVKLVIFSVRKVRGQIK